MPSNFALQFDDLDSLGAQGGNVSPRTIKALQKCAILDKVAVHVLPAIVDNASRKICMPGDRLLRAGDRSESMFIVCSGKLRVEVNGVEVRTMGAGDSFGEVAVFAFRTWVLHREHAELLGNATALESLLTRTADVICVEHSVLLELTVQDIDALFKTCPRLVYNMWRIGTGQLRQCALEGSEQAQSALATVADLHPLLAAGWLHHVSSEDVLHIIDTIRPEHLPARHLTPGEHVMRQGKLGDSAFLVTSGLYSCVVDGVEVRQFGPWSAFGEVGLCARFPKMVYKCLPAGTSMDRLEEAIRNARARQADVVCIEEGDILEVPCEAITPAFERCHKVFDNIFSKVQDRFLETIAFACNDAKTALACLRQPRSESPMRLMDTRGKTESPPPKGRYINPKRAARVRPESTGDPSSPGGGGGGGGGGAAAADADAVVAAAAAVSAAAERDLTVESPTGAPAARGRWGGGMGGSAQRLVVVGDGEAAVGDGDRSPVRLAVDGASGGAETPSGRGAGVAGTPPLVRSASESARMARRLQRMNWD